MSRPTLKISPSLLDLFRQVTAGEYDKDAQTIRDRLLGKYEPSGAAMRGTAFHKLIEDGTEKYRTYQVNGKRCTISITDSGLTDIFDFYDAVVDEAERMHQKHKGLPAEFWVSKTFDDVLGYDIVMNGRLDRLNGLEIVDYKTTARQKKTDDYYHSLQWRCYFELVPEAEKFRFIVFQLNDSNTQIDTREFRFDREPFSVVLDWLGGFVAWLKMPCNEDILNALKYTPK